MALSLAAPTMVAFQAPLMAPARPTVRPMMSAADGM
jgi:hypothetical protein